MDEIKETVGTQNENDNTENNESTPKLEDLLAEIATLKVEAGKTKSALDKALKEKGEITKQLRSKMDDDEKRIADEKEREQYVLGLEKQIKTANAKERYLAMGMDGELATKSANAEIEGDMDALLGYININKENAIKSAKESWLSSRARVNTGEGSKTITQEQFNNMTVTERSKLYKENPEEYQRLSKSN